MSDSHIALPQDNRSFTEVEKEDLFPFITLIKCGIPAIMAAHIVYPKIDSLPVGFSSIWLKDILRHHLGFTGTIFSDDMNMQGAGFFLSYVERVIAAREAGCDFVLLCNNREAVIEVLNNIDSNQHQVSAEKWVNLRGIFTLNRKQAEISLQPA
jgi:beta-N-acetylhexosaminidase